MKVLNKATSLAPQMGEPLYFPTENGAPLNNHLEVSDQKPLKRSISKKAHSSVMLDKMLGEMKVNESKLTPIQRFQWAVRQTIIRNRVAKLGFSLTRTRVAKSSSVLDRLERIEQRLFYLPMEVADKVSQLEQTLSRKISHELSAIEDKHREANLKNIENMNALEAKYDRLHHEVVKIEEILGTIRTELTTSIQTESKKLMDNILQLQGNREEDAKLHHQSLRDKLVTLTSSFKTVELGIGKVGKEIASVIKGNDANYKKGTDEVAAILLKSDTDLKQLREKFTAYQSDLFALHTYASSLKQEVATMLGSHAGELLAQIEDVVTEGLGEVELQVEQVKTQLQKHDDFIAERWNTLSNIPKSAREVKTLADKLDNLKSEVENKVSSSEVHELLREIMPPPSEVVITPAPVIEPPVPTTDPEPAPRRGSLGDPLMKEKMELLSTQLKELTDRLSNLEISRSSPSPQGARTPAISASFHPSPAFSSTPRDSTQIQEVAALVSQPNWNQAEFEAQIQPLVKEIVNMYLADWEESQGYYDQEYYPDEEIDGELPANEEGSEIDMNEKKDSRPSTAKDPLVKLKDFGSVDLSTPRLDRSESPKPQSMKAKPTPRSRVTIREKPKESVDDEIEVDKPISRPTSHRRTEVKSQPSTSSIDTRGEVRRPKKSEDILEKRKDYDSSSEAGDEKSKKLHDEELDLTPALPPVKPPTEVPQRRLNPSNSRSRDFDEHRPRRPMGPTVDPAEVTKLKNDLKELQDKFEKMNKAMMDKETLKSLLNQKADTRLVASKVDAKVIETIEAAMKDCVAEVGDLKQLREDDIEKLKAGVEKKIKSSLKALLKANLDEMKSASASFKSLCLSCGQQSPVHVHSSQNSAPPFLPSLNSHSTAGPEVFRGGFRMPVAPQQSGLIGPGSLVLGSNMSLLSIDESLLSDGDAGKRITSKKQKPVPSHVPSPTYVEESACARSIHRKGFPGKKSNRAVVSPLSRRSL